MLVEGPAGTGKSRGIAEFLYAVMGTYPGARIAVIRKTRVSLTESWLVTWENEVLGQDHPMVLNGPSRAHRTVYEHPITGATLTLGGLDNPTRLYSTQYSLIYCNECTEFSLEEYESLHRALRDQGMPWRLLLSDCNPDAEHHWLHQRTLEGTCLSLPTELSDNPALTQDYLERLEGSLSGVRRERLFYGRWVSAEGVVWEEYREGENLLNYVQDEPDEHPRERIRDEDSPDHMRWRIKCKWTFASMDVGLRHPGTVQVWGCYDDDIYLLAEVYRTEKRQDWWADRICELHEEFDLQAIVVDPSEPEWIEVLNDRIAAHDGKAVRIARKAKNALKVGLDTVGEAFKSKRLWLSRDVLRFGRDEARVNAHKPWCLTQEIPSYSWPLAVSGKPIKEKPDQTCSDHGCDALRYAAMFAWMRDLGPTPGPKKFKRGSIGDFLGHDPGDFPGPG